MKKRAWLIYDVLGAEKNKNYIQMHIDEGKKMQIAFQFLYAEKMGMVFQNGESQVVYDGKIIEKPDFAICRTIQPRLSFLMEEAGIRVWNPAIVSAYANDKAKTCAFYAKQGIPTVTTTAYSNGWFREHLHTLEEGCVIKAVAGHGGSQVFRYQKGNEAEILQGIGNAEVIVQPYIKGKNQDLRVYVIGKEIIGAVLRTAQSGFKSNFSLGGKVAWYQLQPLEKALVEKIISYFPFGYVGIDFIIDENGACILNEIEDVVGARMLYQVADINVLQRYFSFILEQEMGV